MSLGKLPRKKVFWIAYAVFIVTFAVVFFLHTSVYPGNKEAADVEQSLNSKETHLETEVQSSIKDPEVEHQNPAEDKTLSPSSNLFDLHPPQKFVWDSPPQVCAVFLSCKRPTLLEKTVSAFIKYMAKNEPNITYETILWDNDSGVEFISNVMHTLPIDRVIVSRQNVGIAYPFDQLLFHNCRSEYILSLEEDWEAQEGFENFPVIRMSMDILDSDSKVHEVWLRYDSHGYKHNSSHWLTTPKNPLLQQFISDGQTQYHRSKGLETWGTYTNGASLKSRKKFLEIGPYHPPPSRPDSEEYFYNQFIQSLDFFSAHLCMNADANLFKRNRCAENETSIHSPQLFVHIGTGSRSPGHAD
ncbi:hypothetical protein HDV01_004278 [Terramyces sp. JEL0728]|nr:hypothetical protein HDV01_004278 [Terramyces sp. JEL0728]